MVVTSPDWTTTCLNCGEALTGRFCPQCGQRALPPHPTVRQLAGEAWSELVGWDGKAARTLRTLLVRPGELTRSLLEGQRTRHISPVRLYLTCSLVYFLVAAAAPVPEIELDAGFSVGISTQSGTQDEDLQAGEAEFGRALTNGLATLSPDDQRAAVGFVDGQSWLLRPMFHAMAVDYPGLKRRVTAAMPRAFFVLVPALAGILALFHRRRPFPDHLYFALHVQSFVFLAGSVVQATYFSRSILVMGIAQGAAAVAILAHLVLAGRRVYGGGWLASAAKAAAVGVLYLSLFSVVALAVTLWVARAS
jgi:hypothetical protein